MLLKVDSGSAGSRRFGIFTGTESACDCFNSAPKPCSSSKSQLSGLKNNVRWITVLASKPVVFWEQTQELLSTAVWYPSGRTISRLACGSSCSGMRRAFASTLVSESSGSGRCAPADSRTARSLTEIRIWVRLSLEPELSPFCGRPPVLQVLEQGQVRPRGFRARTGLVRKLYQVAANRLP